MSLDITHCAGGECPLKGTCYRFTQYYKLCTKEKKKIVYISKFPVPPYIIDRGKFTCDMFWGDASQYLLEQLKSIFNGEKTKTKRVRNTKQLRRNRNKIGFKQSKKKTK